MFLHKWGDSHTYFSCNMAVFSYHSMDSFLIRILRTSSSRSGLTVENIRLYTCILHLHAFGSLCVLQNTYRVSSQRSIGLVQGKHIWTFNRHCWNTLQKATESRTALFPSSAVWLISASTTGNPWLWEPHSSGRPLSCHCCGSPLYQLSLLCSP